jgi:hypothetical protein
MSAGGIGGCSEYCARLCEAVYTACEHALSFLLATAPVVEPGEVAAAAAGAGGLGDTWPAAKALAALQVGCRGKLRCCGVWCVVCGVWCACGMGSLAAAVGRMGCVRLVYTACEHALAFLLATAPVVQ